MNPQAIWVRALPGVGGDVDARKGGCGGGGGNGAVARSSPDDAGDGEVAYEGVGKATELWMICLARDRQR